MFVRKHICSDFSRNSFKIFRDSQRELERVFSEGNSFMELCTEPPMYRFLGFVSRNSPRVF
jgi:hypothetical protein